MKYALLFAATLVSGAALAGTPNYDSCSQNSDTDVCQAYLAGLNHGKAQQDTVMAETESKFRSRALEQRVGERTRKTAAFDKTIDPMTK
ncbi:hypothetical protein ABT56_14885 [Photobacterium aquae]|uniref:Uncharacterized protein n=1 Tax=Photobacterium aquae TaxID=1195763 RepID=A0A0J1GXN7_9GAMM|nr:hypothetical protein [Photobacterium aquae]KLV04421.1 hypothetical protein ABT56_14885 [Photobacterium aquae]